MRSRFAAILLAGAFTLVGGSLSAVSASAATTAAATAASAGPGAAAPRGGPDGVVLPGVVSSTPASYTPNVYAGTSCGSACSHPKSTIYSTAVVNGEVVVAGAFSAVCTPASAAPTYAECPATVTADYVFAFNPANGAIDPDFQPIINSGPVYSVAAGPNNTVYIGGEFTTVNGAAAGGLAQLSVTPGQPTDGQLVPAFTGQTNGTVTALAYNGNALYIGGEFSKVDGKARKIARLNATTGVLDNKFGFTLSNPAPGEPLRVKVIALTGDGSTLAIAGTFLDVDGQGDPRLALISTGGGLNKTATLDNWSAPILSNNCSAQHDYVNGVDFSADGSFLVLDNTGYMAGGQPGLCDAAARFETGATGQVQPTWISYAGGDSFRSIAIAGNVVYLGGHQRWANNQCGNNSACEANVVLVNGIAAVDANTGLALPWWHPQTARGVGVQSLTPFPAGAFPGSDGGLLLGTDVSNIGGTQHNELAMFPMTTTAAQTPGGPILSGMFLQGRLGGSDESSAGVPDMCVDDAGNASTPGTPAELVTCVNDNEQNWTINADGTITVNGLCLDTQGGGTTPGTPVELDTCDGSTSQQWLPGAGNILVNQASGNCLDDPGASTTSGVQLDIAACNGTSSQSWPLPSAQAPPPPPVSGPIFPQELEKSTAVPCVSDLNGSTQPGNPIALNTCLGQVAQTWTLAADGTVVFKKKWCLDTQGGGTTSGTPIVLDTCDGSPTQVWAAGPGRELIDQGASQGGTNMCLDDPGFQTSNGTKLQLWSCNDGTNQQWHLPTY